MAPKSLKKVSTTVYLPPRLLEGLQVVKKRTGLKMASLIRRGIRDVLELYGAIEFTQEEDGYAQRSRRKS